MINRIHKSAVVMMLMMGLLFVTAAPTAEAKDRCRKRGYQSVGFDNDRYDNNRYYDDRDYRSERRRRDRDYEYYNEYDREDTKGKVLKRAGIGAGIGALGGALIGGKKGALIGAGVGAAGGYLYHRNKVNKERDRYYRY